MSTSTLPEARLSHFWNDDSRRLAAIAGGITLGAYVLTHPRVLKMGLVLGLAELVRRHVAVEGSLPSFRRANEVHRDNAIRARAVTTIACDPQRAYQFWRDLNNAPLFMSAVGSVRVVSDEVAVWTMKPAAGRSFSWVGETTNDVPGERIAWTVIGSDVLRGSGDVEFRGGLVPGTTEVLLSQNIEPALSVSNWLTRGYLSRHLHETLRRFKQFLETGEIARTTGQPEGSRTFAARVAHDYVKPVLIPS